MFKYAEKAVLLTPGVTTLGPLCVWFRVLHQPSGEIIVILGLDAGGGVEKCGEDDLPYPGAMESEDSMT